RGHDVAGLGEIRVIVGIHFVVVHAALAADLHLLVGAGQREDQQPAGVIGGDVVVDVGAHGVLDFDAGHVALGAIAADDAVLRLADVDAGIRAVGHHAIFNQHVLAKHGINAVGAVFGMRAAGPLDVHFAEGHALDALNLDGVGLGIFHGQVADGHVAALDQ